jgi:hypothetical protein
LALAAAASAEAYQSSEDTDLGGGIIIPERALHGEEAPVPSDLVAYLAVACVCLVMLAGISLIVTYYHLLVRHAEMRKLAETVKRLLP